MLRDALPELDELDAMTKHWIQPKPNQIINRNNVNAFPNNMPAGP
jgi:hypothetical protein